MARVVLVAAALFAGCIDNPGFKLAPDDEVVTGAGSTTDVAEGTGDAASGSGAPTTGTGPDATTGEPAVCGDGVRGGAEECDDGADNGDDRGCTSECRLAVCGDGLVQAAEEQCDHGASNGDAARCTGQCLFAACGDGLVLAEGPEPEGCDEGAFNAWAPGACSPDCMKVIPAQLLTIYMTPPKVFGNLSTVENMQLKGIPAGDAACEFEFPGTRAMVADGVVRRATIDAWVGGEQGLDWVLHPYQGYANANGQFVGLTGKEGLLGVRNGELTGAIEAPLGPEQAVRTGMRSDWTATDLDCEDWQVNGPGPPYSTIGNAASKSGYLDELNKANCFDPLPLYCAQQ